MGCGISVDEVGDYGRYCRVVCCHTQQLLFFGHFPLHVLGAFRLIFVQSTCVITSVENANLARLRAW